MQAIQTKYLPATNFKPSRIKAFCAAGSVTISFPHEFSGQKCHRQAAEALAVKLGWDYQTKPYPEGYTPRGKLLGGCLPNGDSCFVFNNDWALE